MNSEGGNTTYLYWPQSQHLWEASHFVKVRNHDHLWNLREVWTISKVAFSWKSVVNALSITQFVAAQEMPKAVAILRVKGKRSSDQGSGIQYNDGENPVLLHSHQIYVVIAFFGPISPRFGSLVKRKQTKNTKPSKKAPQKPNQGNYFPPKNNP